MERTSLAAILLAGLAARPALAHPGHGLPGWLHHGETLALAAIAIGALAAWRRSAARAPRRDGR
jgi:hypothetical protein